MLQATLYQGRCCRFLVLDALELANDRVVRKSMGQEQCWGEGRLVGRAEVKIEKQIFNQNDLVHPQRGENPQPRSGGQ